MVSSLPIAPAPLFPGQRLTREEFLRRWEAIPELKNAELIDGIVYMPSPVGLGHAKHDMAVHGWLMHYAWATPGCEAASNATWLMLDAAPQPDAGLRINPQSGGQSGNQGLYAQGAPELAVEVCASTSAYDLGPKLALYQRAGVREYVTLILEPAQVLWRVLVDGSYVLMAPDGDGVLRSRVFPGLWLDPQALLAGDGGQVISVLDRGIASPEHLRFVQQLHQVSRSSETP